MLLCCPVSVGQESQDGLAASPASETPKAGLTKELNPSAETARILFLKDCWIEGLCSYPAVGYMLPCESIHKALCFRVVPFVYFLLRFLCSGRCIGKHIAVSDV